jgi:hypothetical protein
MLQNLTNFKSLFNNLNGLENFQTDNQANSPKQFINEEQDEKKSFTLPLRPYDFESNDPIGDLFRRVDLDGSVKSPKKASRSKVDSEASLITECPPGSKPVGEINVNSTYLRCKPDGTPVRPEPEHKFLSEKNSCVFKAKYKSPNSAVASTLMPKASNVRTETETEKEDIVTRSANGSRVMSDLKGKNRYVAEKFQVSEREMVTRSASGSDVFSELNKHTYSGKQSKMPKSFKLSKEDERMVTRSGTGTDVLSEIMSDSGLSTSPLSSSAALNADKVATSKSESASSSASSTSSAPASSASASSSLVSSAKKVDVSDVKSYKQAVQKAAKQKYETSDN